MYRTLNAYYQERFGCKVYKLAIDGGFTCPNRDGTVGTGGCIFCSAYGDGAKRDLVAPLWSADKKRVLNYLNAFLRT